MRIPFKKLAGPFKWVLAIVLLVVVIRSGKLDFGQLKIFLTQPATALLCLGITLFWYSLCFVRWRLLLKSQDIVIPFRVAFQLGMLGQFFQTFMPGTVGADLAKAVYIGRRFPTQKLRAVFSVVVDRAVGLYSILMLGALAFVLGFSKIAQMQHRHIPLVQSLGYFLVAVALVGLLSLLLLPFFKPFVARFRPYLRRFPMLIKTPFRHAEKIILQYSDRPRALWLSVFISLLTHSLAVLILFLIARSMFGVEVWGQLDTAGFVLAASLGLVAMALPISPHGLGVGQVAFASIFSAMGVSNPVFGASIVTAFQLVTLVANLLGFASFVTHKHEVGDLESVES
jgi:glycosyltransferase 2 family protein